jgi:geranylgeranyl diphosphate synthase type I
MTRGFALKSPAVPESIGRVRPLVEEVMRSAVKVLDPHMAFIASYQLGWCDAEGRPTASGGKSLRPALVVVAAEAAGGTAEQAMPGAAAVELIHNFSLLHDDVMDDDVERRHRPTGWVVFGKSQAILAGSAMLAAAVELLTVDTAAGARTIPCLLEATQRLIAGQSADIRLETTAGVPSIAECLEMEAGKTAALLACATSIGALAAGAPGDVVAALGTFGHELGMAFQLVDDVLGIVGDPALTGKSSSSDVRAGKRSAPVVAALNGLGAEAAELARRMKAGLPSSEQEVAQLTDLIVSGGGVAWASAEADRRLASALMQLDRVSLDGPARAELGALARYVVTRIS